MEHYAAAAAIGASTARTIGLIRAKKAFFAAAAAFASASRSCTSNCRGVSTLIS
jgi:hypothetical protein